MTRRHERMIMAAGVAVALALVGVQAWSLRDRLADGAMPMAATAAEQATVLADSEPDLAPILAFAPFGQVDAVPLAESPALADSAVLPVLLGITLAEEATASRAILGLPDGTAKSVGIGDALPDGGHLVAVRADHIVIRAAEADVVLRFPADPADLAAVPGAGPDLQNLIPIAARPPAPEALLTGIKMAMNLDPEGYIAGLGLRPDSGGYRVLPQVDGALQQAGLRPGDLVASVNGLAPGDADRDLAILDTVARAGTAILEVTRDGQPLTLTVPVE